MESKDTPVIVERVGNGYQVRPMFEPGNSVCVRDIMVFQDKGIASPARDYQSAESTLFGWLDQHFSSEDRKA